MNANLQNAINALVAKEGADVLLDVTRVDAALPVFANREAQAERAAFLESLKAKAAQARPKAPQAQTYTPPRQESSQAYTAPAVSTPSRKKPITKIVLAVLAASVLAALVVMLCVARSANGWQGYASYEDFAKDRRLEFWGRPLDEEGFRALMALAFLGSFSSDEISFDIVSGEKLSAHYGVPQRLRRYNYLTKEGYIVFFNGEVWVVGHFTK